MIQQAPQLRSRVWIPRPVNLVTLVVLPTKLDVSSDLTDLHSNMVTTREARVQLGVNEEICRPKLHGCPSRLCKPFGSSSTAGFIGSPQSTRHRSAAFQVLCCMLLR